MVANFYRLATHFNFTVMRMRTCVCTCVCACGVCLCVHVCVRVCVHVVCVYACMCACVCVSGLLDDYGQDLASVVALICRHEELREISLPMIR